MKVALDLAERGLNGDPRRVLGQLTELGDRPGATAALAFCHVLACDFDVAVALAESLGDGELDRGVRGFVRSLCLGQPGEPPATPSAAAQESSMIAFVEQEWAMSAGRVDLAEQLARRNLASAATPSRRTWAAQALVRALCFQGRVTEAVDVVVEWPDVFEPVPGDVAGELLAAAVVFASALGGSDDRAAELADRLAARDEPETYLTAGPMVLVAFALAAGGNAPAAAALMRRAGGDHLRRLQQVDRVYAHEILLEDELLRGDLAAAAERVELLGTLPIEAHDLAAAAAARCRARFADAVRDTDGATAESAIAARRAERVKGRLEVLRAEVLAAGARAGVDRRSAIAQFDEVSSRAAETGVQSIREWARRELRRTGRRLRDVPNLGWDALTPQQALVARLAAAGARNREIAAQLFVSERTVEGHVRAILRTLGAPSRVEIGAHVPLDPQARPSVPLTARQQDVAALVVEGRTNREIAFILGVGDKTVEKHLSDLFARLGVRSRAGVAAAMRSDPR